MDAFVFFYLRTVKNLNKNRENTLQKETLHIIAVFVSFFARYNPDNTLEKCTFH